MTNQQSIDRLLSLSSWWDKDSEQYQAIVMAISALQAQDSPKPTAESVQNVKDDDLVSRKAAIDAVEHIASSMSICVNTDECHGMKRMQRQAVIELANLPSAQPTLCGYDIEHLILIANVLRKENLPPERVIEALTNIGRIVSIVTDEFEESLRNAVESARFNQQTGCD